MLPWNSKLYSGVPLKISTTLKYQHSNNIHWKYQQNILFIRQLSYCTVACFSVMYDFRHNQYAGGRSIAPVMWLSLLLSGIESNHVPTKYLCGECDKTICYGRSMVYGQVHQNKPLNPVLLKHQKSILSSFISTASLYELFY